MRPTKDNETKQFGEFRTKRLVMQAWHNFGFEIKKCYEQK